ncbi:hypothetical protein ES705_45220 [subsurface metagenome]
MIKQIKEIIKDTYFDKHMSLTVVCIGLIVSSIFVTIVFSLVTFI